MFKEKVILTTENILSPSMSKWRVTKQDTKEIASTLGTGSPTAAIAMNLDIDQIQKIKLINIIFMIRYFRVS